MPSQIPLFGTAKKRIDLVIDVANMAHRAANRFKDLSHDGVPTGHIYGAFSMLLALVKHHGQKADYRIVLAEEGRCQWRRDLYPAYKGNRGHGSGVTGILPEVSRVLSLVPSLTIRSADDEADDAIATHVSTNHDVQHVVFSKDRDLWQLLGLNNVKVIESSTDPEIHYTQLAETFMTTAPALVPFAKALLGDASDNISGVPRFARDDAYMIFERMLADRPATADDKPEVLYEDFLRAAETCKEDLKPRTLGLIRDHHDQIITTMKVTTLRRDARLACTKNPGDRTALEGELQRRACRTIVERLGEFAWK